MMGAYDLNPRAELSYGEDSQQPWSPSMDGGLPAVANLSDRFSALGVGDSSKDQLFQVKKAVEDAEAIIIQQLEENSHLRDELQRRTQELEQLKLGATSIRSSADLPRDEHNHYKVQPLNSPPGNEADSIRWLSKSPSTDLHGTLAIQQTGNQESEAPSSQPGSGNHYYPESGKLNETLKGFSGVQSGIENSGISRLSTPSSRSLSPSRNRKEGDYDPRLTLPGQGLLPATDVNLNVLWKQDLIVKVREREEEIIQLRKHLADYSVKESQIRNEKYVLEKRIAYMRMAFDQQQQDLVDAASKALSYRQDIIEENIRLTYALQAAQQERSTFVSSLLPLLSEYSLQPNVLDAQSIVGNLKVLFKHLQEKLIITEEKLKESQYQLTPWRQEISNNTSFPSQSSSHTLGASLATPNNNSLEIVPQPPYSHVLSPVSSPSNAQTRVNWDALGKQNHHSTSSGVATRNLEVENLPRTSPFVGRASVPEDRLAIGDQATHSSIESRNQNPSLKDYAVGNIVDDIDAAVVQPGRETPVHWGSGSSPYTPSALDEPNSSYPYLPTVLEEPGSSVSEAADDDPLPAIEGLQISGDAFPGRELQASGYSINGTTSCNFEWVRYLEDGSVNYIDGAKQPKYLVTADDVDSYLAIEVQPLDNRKRKGELVKVFANDQRKITCDPEMQEQIEKAYSVGHVSFEVALSARALDIWERATLAVKREGYSIKCNGPRGVVVTEKFQPSTAIMIPYGQPTEFSITCASDLEYLLRASETDSSRDTIVLTMRLFKMRAVEKKKSKKRGLFFK